MKQRQNERNAKKNKTERQKHKYKNVDNEH